MEGLREDQELFMDWMIYSDFGLGFRVEGRRFGREDC